MEQLSAGWHLEHDEGHLENQAEAPPPEQQEIFYSAEREKHKKPAKEEIY
jgi:hypothetical protein